MLKQVNINNNPENTILGLDLGTNSVGWALFHADDSGNPTKLIDLGVRIFQRSVGDKTPTPKNAERRNKRLARRVLDRRRRRKLRMLHYLISLQLLPQELAEHAQPELWLSAKHDPHGISDPLQLRSRALDTQLSPYQLGRVLLHLVQRRGFQSNKKNLYADMLDDPDVKAVLAEEGEEQGENSEEKGFLKEVVNLRQKIIDSGYRTLGEYLYNRPDGEVKRNRIHAGGTLRTDRQMYKEEFDAIIKAQLPYHPILTEVRENLYQIIFFQRPLKLRKDRVGSCSLELEPKRKRAKKAWPQYQQFRYLQDINHLQYRQRQTQKMQALNDEQRQKLIEAFETKANITISDIKKAIGIARNDELNFDKADNKKFKGNLTTIKIREVYADWDKLAATQQQQLIEDLLSYEKRSALKKRLMKHWGLTAEAAIKLATSEFEAGHADVSLRAIDKLLPYLRQGQIYAQARVCAGYGYDIKESEVLPQLPAIPDIPNPIVSRGLSEVKRVVNAIIKAYGKPAIIRLEMARDLEMNTKRYAESRKQQRNNTQLNGEAAEQYQSVVQQNPSLGYRSYASRDDKLKYRLWKEQEHRCAYSNKQISLTQLFSAAVEVDHILPYSLTLNDSYMNKVVSFASENQHKGQRTPKDAFAGDSDKWTQIEGSIQRWYSAKGLKNKRMAFYKSADDLDKDFIASQLTDTRYIGREALHYLKRLGSDVSIVKGQMTAWLRHQWDMNRLLDDAAAEKDRTDHRHHAIDAAVIACVSRSYYQHIVTKAKQLERQGSSFNKDRLILQPHYSQFNTEVAQRLSNIIIAHAPQRKISAGLHEDTGAGFIEGLGTVYRKSLDTSITKAQINKIIDPIVRLQVLRHLQRHDGDPKKAFSADKIVYHKDGWTPIKRVRTLQSKTTLAKLEQSKLGIKDKQGKVFRWMTFGNCHHVEVFRHGKTNKVKGEVFNAWQVKKRANKKRSLLIKRLTDDLQGEYQFLYALHINDLVYVTQNDEKCIYRVQKMNVNKIVTLRLHTEATLQNKEVEIEKTIESLVNEFQLQPLTVNVLGKPLDKYD